MPIKLEYDFSTSTLNHACRVILSNILKYIKKLQIRIYLIIIEADRDLQERSDSMKMLHIVIKLNMSIFNSVHEQRKSPLMKTLNITS